MAFIYSWFCFKILKTRQKNSEDGSESDREKNTQGNNLDEELKDKYKTTVHK